MNNLPPITVSYRLFSLHVLTEYADLLAAFEKLRGELMASREDMSDDGRAWLQGRVEDALFAMRDYRQMVTRLLFTAVEWGGMPENHGRLTRLLADVLRNEFAAKEELARVEREHAAAIAALEAKVEALTELTRTRKQYA